MDDEYRFGRYLSSPPPGEEIVITGISGRYPESKNIHEFRDNLFNKKDMITEDDRRWGSCHPDVPKGGAKVDDIDRFDAGYFGVHYRQADVMDPMLRKFLETSIEAIMDAGVNLSELEGTRTGVFVGGCFSELETKTLADIQTPQKFGITGYLRCFLPNRISYYLKLKGPSVLVDTACSSSMNALETAFRAIRSGQCENALVGGVNILLHPGMTLQFYRLGLLSKDSHCKVFDETADGYVRGEAIVSVLLQKAKNAKRIYGQVLYTKVNSDGFKPQGITYPSTQMQQELMEKCLQECGITPDDFSYLEAHGTGTEVGDPEEIEAIDKAIARHRKKPLKIGSVKSSIGHSEPVSGLCALSKVIIAMETGRIPPHINLKNIKKVLYSVLEGRLKIVLDETELEGDRAIVGINNFGFGGNNCHLMVQRFGKVKNNGGMPDDDLPRLVCVSGRTEDAVLTLLNDLNTKALDSEHVGLLHHTFKNNIKNHLYRGYSILSKNGPVKASVKLLTYPTPLYVFFGNFQNCCRNVGKYLLQYPVFKDTMQRINTYLVEGDINIIDVILNEKEGCENDYLAATAVQVGIVDLIKKLELHPSAVYEDSVDKLVTAYHYEVATLKEVTLAACKYKNSFKNQSDVDFEEIMSDLKEKIKSDDDGYFTSKIKTSRSITEDNYEHFVSNNLRNIHKKSVVLNISDERISDTDVLLIENDSIKFLEVLGSLYEKGHNPQLHKLYPPVEYPVSRATPMISPFIKWNYDKKWYVYKFTNFQISDSEQQEYQTNYHLDEYKYISGHVVDGRNLFPATEYLRIVWETFAHSRKLLTNDLRVVFENCKFIRAVTLPSNGFVKLLVFIQQNSGNFEVLEGNSLVVSGRIHSPSDISVYQSHLKTSIPEETDSTPFLKQDEIYRELYLRGYNYSGLFKGIIKCNVDASFGFVQWEDNWTTFMDKMLQIKILQIDTRLLYVPVGIARLVIDPFEHLKNVKEGNKTVFPVHVFKECNIIKSGGIEVCGLQAKSILKRKSLVQPVLEKHVFVPNKRCYDLFTSIRVNTQIVLENCLDASFKAVEIADENVSNDSEFLLPLISQVLEDVPMIKPDLTISTKVILDSIPGVKTEYVSLTRASNVTLLIGNKLLQRPNFKVLLNSLSPSGFGLSREDVNLILDNQDIDVVTEFVTPTEKIILFQRAKEFQETKFIKVSSLNFEWLPQLQQALKDYPNVTVYGQDQEFDGVMGMVNCIRREPGGHKVKCFLIMDQAPEFHPENPFYQQQIKKNLAINVFKDGEWGTYRHLLLEDPEGVESEHVRVNTLSRGDLSSLRWIEGPLTLETAMQPNSTLVQCNYASINFKDIMVASGRINIDVFSTNRLEQDCWLGFEYSGRDMNGNRVAGMNTSASMSTLIEADPYSLWKIPDDWSLEEAATIPVIYSTVIYSLLKVTTLKPGTSILIHSATGGVGMAALNVCIYHGCEIFVTVGTQEKRNYLRKHFPQIPDSHIGNSRNVSFEEMVKKETRGRGVDLVLNSLTEEKLMASVRCLAKGGRFLEIGKYDLANDTSLKMLLMEKEISYHGVMVDHFHSREVKIWLVNKITEGIKEGYVKPLPRTIFQKNEIEKAFRYMTTGKHMGKVLIKVKDEDHEKVVKPVKTLSKGYPRFYCDSEKSYIIVGGLGGFGLELTDWLVLRGARNVILVSSSGITTGYQLQRIRIWESYGVNILISRSNVTTKEGCIQLIEESTKLGTVDAVFNLAVVLKDGLFENQTIENFNISLAPKAYATKHLDEVTREHCPQLRYFVIFSSVSCGRGNAGQTNYGMANSIMERICERRKRDGYPALAVQWGAIGDVKVGLVAKMQKENRELVIGGTLQQKVSSCLEVLDRFLKQNNPVVASMVVAEKKRNYGVESAVEAVAHILGIKDIKTVSQHLTLAELGMDSMMGTEVMQALEKDFEIYVTTKDIRSMTFARLSELEAEKKAVDTVKKGEKSEQGTNFLLQHVPCYKSSESTILRLPSRLHEGEDGNTVFVLCGVEGIFKPLEPLVNNLNAHAFGIQYSYNKPEDSIEEIAQTIAPLLEEKVTKGKMFHVIGYSFGVLVALEVTALLEKKGYIANIIALDGSPEYTIAAVRKNLPEDEEDKFQTLLILKLMSILVPTAVLEQHEDSFEKCKNLDERIDLATSLIPRNVSKKDVLQLERQGVFYLYKHFKAVLKYKFVHDKIKSRVHLFKAKYPIVEGMDNDYKFSEVCEQPVEATTMDGDHVTILNQSELVEAINKLLVNVL